MAKQMQRDNEDVIGDEPRFLRVLLPKCLNFLALVARKSHSVYKDKYDVLNRSNYRDLNLIVQVMKVLHRVLEGFFRQRVLVDEMQCVFMPGRDTTYFIFILRQLQKKHKVALIDPEKAFDRVPRKVSWWSVRKLKIDKWPVRIAQSMHKEMRSKVRMGDEKQFV